VEVEAKLKTRKVRRIAKGLAGSMTGNERRGWGDLASRISGGQSVLGATSGPSAVGCFGLRLISSGHFIL
jgi:hypothetical protein